MLLAYLIEYCEDELICDFAETYHIYDIYALNMDYVAKLASGLRNYSRSIMKMSEQKLNPYENLLALIVDRLCVLVWQNTSDGHKGCNMPTFYDDLINPKDNEKCVGFKTGAEFMEAWNNA